MGKAFRAHRISGIYHYFPRTGWQAMATVAGLRQVTPSSVLTALWRKPMKHNPVNQRCFVRLVFNAILGAR